MSLLDEMRKTQEVKASQKKPGKISAWLASLPTKEQADFYEALRDPSLETQVILDVATSRGLNVTHSTLLRFRSEYNTKGNNG